MQDAWRLRDPFTGRIQRRETGPGCPAPAYRPGLRRATGGSSNPSSYHRHIRRTVKIRIAAWIRGGVVRLADASRPLAVHSARVRRLPFWADDCRLGALAEAVCRAMRSECVQQSPLCTEATLAKDALAQGTAKQIPNGCPLKIRAHMRRQQAARLRNAAMWLVVAPCDSRTCIGT